MPPMLLLAFGALLAAMLLGCARPPAGTHGADYVFSHGKVYTVDARRPWAEAVAVTGNKIVYVGDSAGADRLVGENTRVMDLSDQLLVPGFIDTHIHPFLTALFANTLQLDAQDSTEEWLEAIAEYAKENPQRPLVLGFGFDVARFGGAGPHKSMLDKVVPNTPVIIIDAGGHVAWTNSAALARMGITRATPDPIPGSHYFKRDKNGDPTGWLLESQTFMPALARLMPFTREEIKAGADQFFGLLSSVGVTAVFDAGMSSGEELGLEVIAALEREKRLPFRYVASHMIQHPSMVAGAIETFQRLRQRYRTPLLSVGAIKLQNDGSLEAHTAALLEDYADTPGKRGNMLLEGAALRDFVVAVDKAGIDLHIHAIGDRTVHEVLDALEIARREGGQSATRHTVCHVDLARDEDLARFKPLGTIVQNTPFWHQEQNEDWRRALGTARFNRLYRFKLLEREGVRLTFGSDFPASGAIQGISPLHNIEIGHTRQPYGKPDGPILGSADLRLTIETLIKGYTLDAAYQLRMENDIGSIEVGKRADLIVLDDDPFAVDPHEIHTIKVDLTMVDGKVVFERGLKAWVTDKVLGL